LADQVLLKIVCLLMRWLFSLAVLMIRSDRAKDAEQIRRKPVLSGLIKEYERAA
jgi:hypothetical protein